MKYCIFKYHSLLMPVIFPDHVNHCDVKIEGTKLDSAGFFELGEGTIYVPDSISESTGKGPNLERDADLIAKTITSYPVSGFLEF